MRKRVMTDEVIKRATELKKLGFTNKEIAQMLGVNENTLSRYVRVKRTKPSKLELERVLKLVKKIKALPEVKIQQNLEKLSINQLNRLYLSFYQVLNAGERK